jgi:hypothetical protein
MNERLYFILQLVMKHLEHMIAAKVNIGLCCEYGYALDPLSHIHSRISHRDPYIIHHSYVLCKVGTQTDSLYMARY